MPRLFQNAVAGDGGGGKISGADARRYRDDDKDGNPYINIIQYLEVYGYDR